MSNTINHTITNLSVSPMLLRVTYDNTIDVCHLYYPSGACSDMQSATEYVEKLFPAVKRVFTVSGDAVDTVYTKEAGVWYASENQAA